MSSYQSGRVTRCASLDGLRWDFNPALVALDKLRPVVRSTGKARDFFQVGPVRVSIGPIKALLALFNTKIVFDIMYGRDAQGSHGVFGRFACSVGGELSGWGGALDYIEDFASTINPAFNLIPTQASYKDAMVPFEQWGVYASSNEWKFLFDRACTEQSSTACQRVLSGFAEGFGYVRFARWT